MIKDASIPVVAYLRKSPDNKQGKHDKHERRTEKSIAEQKADIETYCQQKGYQILSWYIDEAKSGDDPTRPAFQQLLSDIQSQSCRFQRVVVWAQDRFSRFDSNTQGSINLILLNNDVILESTQEGVLLDPETAEELESQVLPWIRQLAAHEKLKATSKAVSRSLIVAAKEGRVGGPAPYATRRREDGLLEAGDPNHIEVCRWIWDTLDSGHIGRNAVARMLNERRVPSPSGSKWSNTGITEMVQNPVYAGRRSYGKHQRGKHSNIIAGQVCKAKRGRKKTVMDGMDSPGWVGEPIIDRDQWQRVYDRIKEQRTNRNRVHTPGPMVLIGISHCGLCGKVLSSNGKDIARASYRCGGCRVRERQDLPHFDYSIPAKKLHKAVSDKLLSWLDSNVDTIAEKILARLTHGRTKAQKTDAAIASRIAVVEKKLATVRRNMMYVDDPGLLPTFAAEIETLEGELSTLRATESASRQLIGASRKAIEDFANETAEWLRRLRQDIESGDVDKLRIALHALAKDIVVTPMRIDGKTKVESIKIELRHVGNKERTTTNHSLAPVIRIVMESLFAPLFVQYEHHVRNLARTKPR